MAVDPTGMGRYVKRERKPDIVYAACYRPGASLDGVLAVARQMDGDAVVVEVPELEVAIVKYRHAEYEVLPAGHYLGYSGRLDVLYEEDSVGFNQANRETDDAGR